MTDLIKRTYYVPIQMEIDIKVKAAQERAHPSDIVQRAVRLYLQGDRNK